MASENGSNIFERLKEKADPATEARLEAEFARRARSQYERSQARLAELVSDNSGLPTTISSITVLNANKTRRGFLERIFNPILSANNAESYTLSEAIKAVGKGVDTLNRLDIFHNPVSTYFDRPDPTDPSTSPTDLAAFISVTEKSRFMLSSGTWAGANDGSIYANMLYRNMFGGAESLNINASRGTRTRSSYSASFDTPVLSNPDLRWEIGGSASSTRKEWASHEEVVQGGYTRLKWLTPLNHLHELAYSGTWRQNTGLGEKASPTVRADAGDNFKSSITHIWTNDKRDNPLLPTQGYLIKTITELAGFGALKGDVSFGKFEFDTQAAVPIPSADSGVSFTAGLRGGLLYPLAGAGSAHPQMSRINDRFTLGGPTDVRGFRLAGLGPRDGADAVGGDVFLAGGASLLFPLPRVGKDKPLRFQAFINGGRLVGLQEPKSSGIQEGEWHTTDIKKSVQAAVADLGNELPSIAAGVGVVYALPVARFELNVSLPLVVRKGEEARKGLSFGVGISFL